MMAKSILAEIVRMPHKIVGDGWEAALFPYPSPVFAPVDSAPPGAVTFCDDPRLGGMSLARKPLAIMDDLKGEVSMQMKVDVAKVIHGTEAAAIFLPMFMYPPTSAEVQEKVLVFVDNPRLAFIRFIRHFHPQGTVIHPSAVVEPFVQIGKNVAIGAGCVIGGDGCGFWRMTSGPPMMFPQIGGVVLGDDVILQANVCIDRGALGDTVIGAGTVMDNFVHIAHNVKVGRNCIITAHVMMAGSAEVGDDCWVAPSASLLNGVKVGNNCVVGIGAVVMKDVPDGTTVAGMPARRIPVCVPKIKRTEVG